jgi:hypothetical protein
MLPAVQSDDEAGFLANEVYGVPANRLLPTELLAAELAASEIAPEESLGVCLRTSEGRGTRVIEWPVHVYHPSP